VVFAPPAVLTSTDIVHMGIMIIMKSEKLKISQADEWDALTRKQHLALVIR
jgi:hypothetical protein